MNLGLEKIREYYTLDGWDFSFTVEFQDLHGKLRQAVVYVTGAGEKNPLLFRYHPDDGTVSQERLDVISSRIGGHRLWDAIQDEFVECAAEWRRQGGT